MIRIAIGFVLSFVIGAGCRYFDIPAASPPVIPGALIVLAMTLGYSSMDRTSAVRGVSLLPAICAAVLRVYPSRRGNPHQRLEKAYERKTLGIHHVKAIANNPRAVRLLHWRPRPPPRLAKLV